MDVKSLNLTYTQTGGWCIMASYAIYLEYVSQGEYTIEKFIEDYLNYYNPSQEIVDLYYNRPGSNPRSIKAAEDAICAHYHYYCGVQNWSGLEFVKQLHEKEIINKNYNFSIQTCKFQRTYLSGVDVDELRHLITNGKIAIVYGNAHAVILSYDEEKKTYFTRDPQKAYIQYEDFLSNHQISEYLLFEEQ
jgi:hypothetical protein